MELEKLNKEEFTLNRSVRGVPSIRFSKNGVIILNPAAIKHLKLFDEKKGLYYCVHIYQDKKDHGEFFITRDPEGWQLRKGSNRSGVFNNVCLCRHIIDMTWQKISHAVDLAKPLNYFFHIALLPVDDDKNKDIYALIRKKD